MKKSTKKDSTAIEIDLQSGRSKSKDTELVVLVTPLGTSRSDLKQIEELVTTSLSSHKNKSDIQRVASAVSDLVKRRKLDKDSSETLTIDVLPSLNQGLIVQGISKDSLTSLEPYSVRKLAVKLLRIIRKKNNAKSVKIFVPSDLVAQEDHKHGFLEALLLADYRFSRYLTKPALIERLKIDIEAIDLNSYRLRSFDKEFSQTVKRCSALVKGTNIAREQVNLPPNDCNPESVTNLCRTMARQTKLSIKVYSESELTRIKAGGILAVGAASARRPRLAKLVHTHQKSSTRRSRRTSKPKIAIVGKGVTFDSGGLSLKAAKAMELMKFDMAGAAAVLGAIHTVAELNLGCEVRAYLPLVENMIDGSATKPGDIITTLKGKTVEVLNTDAEGRLILADALTLAERDGADVIIDLATLTGAVVVGLGTHLAGFYGRDQQLCNSLERAAERAGERVWRLPLVPEQRESLRSSWADLRNISAEPWGGSIVAATFLGEFVSTQKWLHLDIAGVAYSERDSEVLPKGATGFGVRTLVRLIC